VILLGGPVPAGPEPVDPTAWAAAVTALGYGAAYAPVQLGDDATARALADAAASAGIVIAEVGIWRNLIAPDEGERKRCIAEAEQMLDFADRLGARCAVTFAGTLGEGAYGPGDGNFAPDTYALIVDTVKSLIDAVQPQRTRFALECMPTTFPDSPDGYAQLLRDVDRSAFGVHFDPVNLIYSLRLYDEHRAMITRFVEILGDDLVSCHAKDVRFGPDPISHLYETIPGEGGLDYGHLLTTIASLPGDMPLMLEHLDGQAEYARAAGYVRKEAKAAGVELGGRSAP
jgi:sugar phosphate isomerase/epimerase